MKKYVSIQKRKTIRNEVTSICYVFVSLLVALYFIIIAAQDCCVLQNWSDGGYHEYKGTYEILKKEYWRNTNYRFLLCNGDVVDIPSEYILLKERLLSSQQTNEIVFRYQIHRHPFRNTYEAISITSAVDGSVFVDGSFMKSKVQSTAGLYVFLGLCALLPILLWGALSFLGSARNSKHRKR